MQLNKANNKNKKVKEEEKVRKRGRCRSEEKDAGKRRKEWMDGCVDECLGL